MTFPYTVRTLRISTVDVRWCPWLCRAIVTQLDTQASTVDSQSAEMAYTVSRYTGRLPM